MKKVLALLLFVGIVSCKVEDKIPENFDYGQAANGVYTNSFFDLKVVYGKDWEVQNKETVDQLTERGEELVAGDNEQLKKQIKVAKINTAYLFTAFKYELGASVAFNPSMMIIAENPKHKLFGLSIDKYLGHVKNGLDQSQIPYTFSDKMKTRPIGTLEFKVLEAEVDIPGGRITQEYHSAVKNGMFLSFVISYNDEQQKKELYKVLNEVTLEK